MELRKLDQAGSHIIGFMVALLLVGVVAFGAFRVYNQQNADEPAEPVASQSSSEIKNESDLKEAEEELQNINLDDLDTSELDKAESELL